MRAYFNSDNYAPGLPEVMDALAAVNAGHEPAYGHDTVTKRVEGLLKREFGEHAHAFLVFNGTGANVVGLRALLRPWEGVVCAESAHLNVDEGGAPEAVGGIKLLTAPAPDGKLTSELVRRRIVRIGDEHAIQPGVVSVTQSTELGTLYEPHELRALADFAHAHGMRLHIDGARLANAAAALEVPLRAITTDVGADAVSFGGTKAGLMLGEAIVLLGDGLEGAMPYLRKQSMQLASKMRYVAAQFEALLTDELWRRAAGHANAVFAVLPPGVADRLQAEWGFYTWDEHTGEVRWMCAHDTRPEDVDAFAAAVRSAVRAR